MIQGQITPQIEQLLHDFLQPGGSNPDAVGAEVMRLLNMPGLTASDNAVLHYLGTTVAFVWRNYERCALAGEQGYELAVAAHEYPLAQMITSTLAAAYIQLGRVNDAEAALARATSLPS